MHKRQKHRYLTSTRHNVMGRSVEVEPNNDADVTRTSFDTAIGISIGDTTVPLQSEGENRDTQSIQTMEQ